MRGKGEREFRPEVRIRNSIGWTLLPTNEMRPVALLLLIPAVALAGVLRPDVQAKAPESGVGAASLVPIRPRSVDSLLLKRRNVTATLELQGVLVPASWEVLETPVTEGHSSLVLADVLPHGSPVNAGDRVGSLEIQPWLEQREAAELAVAQAERVIFAGKERAGLAQQARAAALKSTEEDLQHKTAALKAHLNVATSLRQRAEKLTEQRLQATVDDQRDELAQLEAMYTQDELVDEVEQIVLRRARRGLATALSQLQLNKDQRAHADSLEHPRQTALLERGVSAAQHALAAIRVEQSLATTEQEAERKAAARTLAEAREALERARTVEASLVFVSTSAGIFLHGGAREWESGLSRPEHRVGDRLPSGRGVFVVAPADRVHVALALSAEQVATARDASVVRALPATGQAARGGSLLVDAFPGPTGKFAATLQIADPWVGVLPGVRAEVAVERVVVADVILVPKEAIHRDAGQAWCLLERARAGGGEEYVRREVVLGSTHPEGTEVVSGLDAGDRVLLGEAP